MTGLVLIPQLNISCARIIDFGLCVSIQPASICDSTHGLNSRHFTGTLVATFFLCLQGTRGVACSLVFFLFAFSKDYEKLSAWSACLSGHCKMLQSSVLLGNMGPFPLSLLPLKRERPISTSGFWEAI